MNITKIFRDNLQSLSCVKKPTIAFLGDSVTQGCFDVYRKLGGGVETYFEQEYAFHRYVHKILGMLYPNVPVNIINAGISGGKAPGGLDRLERDVLCYKPDLTVVCFGLNDCCNEKESLEEYLDALTEIFKKLKNSGSEVIFMTPNMMCTKVSDHLDGDFHNIAKDCMKVQNNGDFEEYINKAIDAAKAQDVRVCDVYSKWKMLYENGVDITELLANKINHPTQKMNWLFAISLVEEMMK